MLYRPHQAKKMQHSICDVRVCLLFSRRPKMFHVGENGVTWHTGLLDKPHITDSWLPLGNIDYHGMIHHHQEVLKKKKSVPVSILVP